MVNVVKETKEIEHGDDRNCVIFCLIIVVFGVITSAITILPDIGENWTILVWIILISLIMLIVIIGAIRSPAYRYTVEIEKKKMLTDEDCKKFNTELELNEDGSACRPKNLP